MIQSRNFSVRAEDVRGAARLLAGVAVITPLLEFAALNERIGRRVLVKFEGVQHTGSFKFRGAYNRLARIAPNARGRGVVAWSSGNHAQGVAMAARLLNIPATIVMPADAPAIKIANTLALGAEVVPYDREIQSREAIATALAQERGATLVPSFDDPFVIAGQGTVGLEIFNQAQEAGADIRQILVNCGGGGLVSGIATVIKDLAPEVDIYAVEPAGFDDTARSLASGRREGVVPGTSSICDSLLAPAPGELTFPINLALLRGGLVVTDAEVRSAISFAFATLKLVIEPGGAVALAALLKGRAPVTSGDVVVVVSGSNVDPDLFAQIITAKAPDDALEALGHVRYPMSDSQSPASPRPRVLLLSTGGTIGSRLEYGKKVYPGGLDLLSDVPSLASQDAEIVLEEIASIGSQDISIAVWRKLHRRIVEALADDHLDAVIVTHGTDTLEETAFLLDCIIPPGQPVVLVGAMRPADAPDADGPANLADAVAVAINQDSRNRGVLLVMAGMIHGARDVRKAAVGDAYGLVSRGAGALGEIVAGQPRYFRPSRPSGAAGRFSLPDQGPLPRVVILHSAADMDSDTVSLGSFQGVAGVVAAGFGQGNLPQLVVRTLAQLDGVSIVRATLIAGARVDHDGEVDDAAYGFIVSRALSPQKSRLLLQLILSRGRAESAAVQRHFDDC